MSTSTKAGHLTTGAEILSDGTWQRIRTVKHSTRIATVMLTLEDGTRIPASIYRDFDAR